MYRVEDAETGRVIFSEQVNQLVELDNELLLSAA